MQQEVRFLSFGCSPTGSIDTQITEVIILIHLASDYKKVPLLPQKTLK